jgi:hypothetical protein
VESIVFVAKNNDDGQDFIEFTGGRLFTSVSFTANHDPESSFFEDELQELKPNLHNLSLYKTIISTTTSVSEHLLHVIEVKLNCNLC